jgi:hypothetical protein
MTSSLIILHVDSAVDGARLDDDGEDSVWGCFRVVRSDIDLSFGGHEKADADYRCGGDFWS